MTGNSILAVADSIATCYRRGMATTREIRRQNLMELLGNYGTNREFADAIGLPAAFVSHMKTGRRNVGDEVARSIETHLGLPRGYMDVPHEDVPAEARSAARHPTGATYGVTPRQIPVISYVQAGDPRPVMDEYMAGDGFRTISLEGEIAEQVGRYTFALQIKGDSMADEFQDGDTVVVDPDAPVRPGDIVVAKLEHDEAATIKKYRERGYDENSRPIIELKPLNEDYAPVTMDARNPGTIIGPVVEHRRRLRR